MSMLFKRIKDWAVSIASFRTGDVIAVDGPNGTAKMSKDDLLKEASQNALAGNLAPAFDPTRTEENKYLKDQSCVYGGKLFVFTEDHYGPWNVSHVRLTTFDAEVDEKISESAYIPIDLDGSGEAVVGQDVAIYIRTDRPVAKGEKIHFILSGTASIVNIALSVDGPYNDSGRMMLLRPFDGETIDVVLTNKKTTSTFCLWTYRSNITTSGSLSYSFNVECLNERIVALEDAVYISKDYPKIILPPKMYVTCNDLAGYRNYSTKMFVDHVVYGITENVDVSFKGGRRTKDFYAKIDSYLNYINSSTSNTTNNIDIKTITDKIIFDKKYEDADFTTQFISTRNKYVENNVCRLLCIGDSVTEGLLSDKGRPYANAPKQYWAWIKALFEMDKIENGNAGFYFESLGNLIGSSNSGVSFDIDFDGVQKQGVKAYACGVGGTTTTSWLSPTVGNAVNPFYDTVNSKFSLRYWVENYRTMTVGSDGISVRCTDETKGPLAGDVNATNVCEPTHVLIQLGYNQSYSGDGDVRTRYINGLSEIIETIGQEYPSVKVILSLPDTPCTYNVKDYEDILCDSNEIYSFDATRSHAKIYHDRFAFMNGDLISLANAHSNAVYAPTFFAVPAIFGAACRSATDLSYLSNGDPRCNGRVMSGALPYLHPNNAAHASIAYTVYSLLKYDMALSN